MYKAPEWHDHEAIVCSHKRLARKHGNGSVEMNGNIRKCHVWLSMDKYGAEMISHFRCDKYAIFSINMIKLLLYYFRGAVILRLTGGQVKIELLYGDVYSWKQINHWPKYQHIYILQKVTDFVYDIRDMGEGAKFWYARIMPVASDIIRPTISSTCFLRFVGLWLQCTP